MSTINTNGWDTVYAVPFSMINDSIVKKSSSPASFSETGIDDNGPIEFSGSFNHWELVTGGDGEQLMMSLPMPKAKFVFGAITYNYVNISANIQLNLTWVNDASDPQYQNLVLNNDPNTVFVTSFNYGSGTASDSEGVMRLYLHKWLVDNIADFQFIFTKVNVNETADQDSFAWMKPTAFGYAVKDSNPASLSTSVFGLLCMTQGRQVPGTPQVSVEAIPAGANSSFLISPERVIENIFFPRIQDVFKGAVSADFQIEPDNLKIRNKNRLQLQNQTLENGAEKEVFVDARNFSLYVLDDKVNIDFSNLYFKYNDNLTVNFNHFSPATLTFPAGVFNLAVTGSNTNVSVEASDGFYIGEIVGSIAGIIITSVIGGFVGGFIDSAVAARTAATLAANGGANIAMQVIPPAGQAAAQAGVNVAGPAIANGAAAGACPISTMFATVWAKAAGNIIGGIVGALVGASIPTTMEIMKGLAKGEIPTLNAFGAAMLAPVVWPMAASTTFEVITGTLNGALQIGIKLKN